MAIQKAVKDTKAPAKQVSKTKAPVKAKKEVAVKTSSSMMEKQKLYAEKLMKTGKVSRKEVAQALVDKFSIAKSSATSYVYRWFIGDDYKFVPKKAKVPKAVVKAVVKAPKKSGVEVLAKTLAKKVPAKAVPAKAVPAKAVPARKATKPKTAELEF